MIPSKGHAASIHWQLNTKHRINGIYGLNLGSNVTGRKRDPDTIRAEILGVSDYLPTSGLNRDTMECTRFTIGSGP